MNDLVSIITPSYNSEKFISKTIKSVLAQTYKKWEMIIVDDTSSDNSNEIIEAFVRNDKRIKLFKLKKNSGPAVTRNVAIQEAKGKYIAFLDADDLWKPNKLEDQIAFMKKNNIAFTYSSYNTIDEEGKSLDKIINPPVSLTYNDMLKENLIGCLTAIYDVDKIGKQFMPLIRKRQDYGLWLSILKNIPKAYKAPGVLAKYRVLNQSISSNKVGLLKYNFELFYKHEKLSFLESIYYVGWNVYRKIRK
jgi:glycosyltransferase involved in cell wall biosynthesis